MSISKNSQTTESSTNQTFKTQRLIIEILFWLISIIVLICFVLLYSSFVGHYIPQSRDLTFILTMMVLLTLLDYEFSIKSFLKKLIFKDSSGIFIITKNRENPTKEELINKAIFWVTCAILVIGFNLLYYYLVNEQEQQLLTNTVSSTSIILTFWILNNFFNAYRY
jgi:hypothetical protein